MFHYLAARRARIWDFKNILKRVGGVNLREQKFPEGFVWATGFVLDVVLFMGPSYGMLGLLRGT